MIKEFILKGVTFLYRFSNIFCYFYLFLRFVSKEKKRINQLNSHLIFCVLRVISKINSIPKEYRSDILLQTWLSVSN